MMQVTRSRRAKNSNNSRREKRRDKQPNGPPPLANMNHSLGRIIRKPVIVRDLIKTVSSASYLAFNSGNQYINLGDALVSSVDFTSVSDSYTLCKVASLTVTLRRAATEATYTTLGLPPFPCFVAFFPARTSYGSSSAATINENHVVMPALDVYQVSKRYPMVNLQSYTTQGGIDYTYNPASWIDVNYIQRIPGCLGVAWDNTGTAASAYTLFTIELTFDCHFAAPF